MGYFRTKKLSSEEMEGCYSYMADDTHEDIIESASGHIGKQGFYNPLPSRSCFYEEMEANKVWIKDNKIVGIDFVVGENKEYCCSYDGISYDDIEAQNKSDIYNQKMLNYNAKFGNLYIQRGTKTPMLKIQTGDKKPRFNDLELRSRGFFPVDIKNNPQLYATYNNKSVVSPNNNNVMECKKIYVNENDIVGYVEYFDIKENEIYNYEIKFNKSIDEQINHDLKELKKNEIQNSNQYQEKKYDGGIQM